MNIDLSVRELLDVADNRDRFPYGPPLNAQHRTAAGDACVRLCEGNQDTARTLWKLVVEDCGGYMPAAAALGLIRASLTVNLVPDVVPDPTSDMG